MKWMSRPDGFFEQFEYAMLRMLPRHRCDRLIKVLCQFKDHAFAYLQRPPYGAKQN